MTTPDALIACLLEIERHVGAQGWDQPARLFALAPTSELLAAEPSLRGQLADTPGSLSSIEQDATEVRSAAGADLLEALDSISWPETVSGCAISVERTFLPTGLEDQLPEDPDEAARFVADHPRRQELRVVAGVTRAGQTHALGRLRGSGELLGSPDLVPGLLRALTRTLV